MKRCVTHKVMNEKMFFWKFGIHVLDQARNPQIKPTLIVLPPSQSWQIGWSRFKIQDQKSITMLLFENLKTAAFIKK